jgi:large subunit ribosomal protein L16
MGKGKGSVDFWCVPVKAGTILFELGGDISDVDAKTALKKGCAKLPIKTIVITNVK